MLKKFFVVLALVALCTARVSAQDLRTRLEAQARQESAALVQAKDGLTVAQGNSATADSDVLTAQADLNARATELTAGQAIETAAATNVVTCQSNLTAAATKVGATLTAFEAAKKLPTNPVNNKTLCDAMTAYDQAVADELAAKQSIADAKKAKVDAATEVARINGLVVAARASLATAQSKAAAAKTAVTAAKTKVQSARDALDKTETLLVPLVTRDGVRELQNNAFTKKDFKDALKADGDLAKLIKDAAKEAAKEALKEELLQKNGPLDRIETGTKASTDAALAAKATAEKAKTAAEATTAAIKALDKKIDALTISVSQQNLTKAAGAALRDEANTKALSAKLAAQSGAWMQDATKIKQLRKLLLESLEKDLKTLIKKAEVAEAGEYRLEPATYFEHCGRLYPASWKLVRILPQIGRP